MYKSVLFILGLLAFASAEAGSVSYGRPLIDRNGSSGSGGIPQLIANPSMVVSVGATGYVTQWGVYISTSGFPGKFEGDVAGTIASVIYIPDPNHSGNYLVSGMDYQTVRFGSNTFANPQYASSLAGIGVGGSNLLVHNSIFGLYSVDVKVSNFSALDALDPWGRSLSYVGGAGCNTIGQPNHPCLPPDGTSLTFTEFGVNPSLGLNNPTPRTYSYLVKANVVPAPPTLWLFGSAMIGWVVTRRKGNEV